MFKFNDTHKFVINLQRRHDRLIEIQKEFDYMGWSFERFEAIDTNSYIGCALSHKAIAKIILERKYNYAIVFEDDIFFMPYAKKLLLNVEADLNKTSWDFFHFAPSIHRPLNQFSEFLVDLSNPPPKDPNKHRGIFGTSAFVLTPKVCEYLIKWDSDDIIENSHQQKPIDEFLDMGVYPIINGFSATLPLVVQRSGYSDINGTIDSNHYTMTYNWNVYYPTKLDANMMDYDFCNRVKYEN